MIYTTGDTHQAVHIGKLKRFLNDEGAHLTKDDYVIVCGDFGLLWNYKETGEYVPSNPADGCWVKKERQLYEWYNALPWTTLFVEGNHENYNRLQTYPVTNWCGGRVQKISDSIIHLMRGEIYTIDGKTIFTFGGAQSTDRGPIANNTDLVVNKAWWPQEIPTDNEVLYGLDNLQNYNNKVDYIITHDCPLQYKNLIFALHGDRYGNERANEVSNKLDNFISIDFKHWYCGHLHRDETVKDLTILFHDVVPITWSEENYND